MGTKRFLIVVCMISFLVLISSCVSVETQKADFMAAIDKAAATYSSALNEGDIDLWLSIHDNDAMKMPQDAPSLVGIEAVEQDIRAGMENILFKDFNIINQEYEFFGDMGYVRGVYSMTLVIKANGAEIPFDGKFLTVYKKQEDGSWKIYRDCFSSNTPPQ